LYPHIRPSRATVRAMGEAVRRLGKEDLKGYLGDAEDAVAELVGHRYVDLAPSGTCALQWALAAAGDKVMVPDQGGWRGFLEYPPVSGIETCFLETELGLIHPETLQQALERETPDALILTSFAGYMAEQDVKEISKLCREYGVILVEDASGAVGDGTLADGRHSDIIICSTGSPKIINVGTGGFITTDNQDLRQRWQDHARACRAEPVVAAGIGAEVDRARRRVRRLLEFSEMLKEELPDAVHRERRGISVGIRLEKIPPKRFTGRAHRAGLVTDLGRGFLTRCPRYDRFKERGVVLELKKLDVEKMDPADVHRIAGILKSCM